MLPTNTVSERDVRPSVVFRKVTGGLRLRLPCGHRSDWGAEIHAGYRSAKTELVCTGLPALRQNHGCRTFFRLSRRRKTALVQRGLRAAVGTVLSLICPEFRSLRLFSVPRQGVLMALACVLNASTAVRLILGDPTAADLATLIREAPLWWPPLRPIPSREGERPMAWGSP